MDSILLDYEEIESIIQLANQITASPSENPELFCQQAKQLSIHLPNRIREHITQLSKCAAILIKTIHVDPSTIPTTPTGNTYSQGETTILAKIQALCLNVIGEMIAYEAEGYGRLFQDIVPLHAMSAAQTSLGSATELEIHTEQAFSNLRPDILSLACLRGNPEAFTYILPVETILQNLPEDDIQLLFQPLWKIGVDLSFKLNGNEFVEGDVRGPIAILSGSLDDPVLTFDQDLMTGITEKANELLRQIIEIYYSHRISHNLQPGEMMFINNNRAVHGRSPFRPNYDGYDRFLVRCFATNHYEKSLYARPQNSRTVAAIYS
jgi:L-asparagine oxygenase